MVGLFVLLLLPDRQPDAGTEDAFWLVGMAAFGTVGARVGSRVPRNPIGWAFLGVSVFTIAAACLGRAPVSDQFAEWLESWTWVPAVAVPITFCLLLFPDGKLPSRRWRPVAWAAAVGIPAFVVSTAIGPDLGGDPEQGANPYHVDVLSPVFSLLSALMIVALFGSVAALVVRFRRSRGVERQQMKWVALAGVTALLLIVAVSVLSTTVGLPAGVANAVVLVAITLIPVSLALAILRYRLYEIDRLISRTVSYTVVVGALVAVYAGGVLIIGTLLPRQNEVAVASSTLAVAALFSPLRRVVQARVDRRFNRARYDAARVIDDFAVRLRDEVDLHALTTDLLGVVAATVQPSAAMVWLREAPDDRAPAR